MIEISQPGTFIHKISQYQQENKKLQGTTPPQDKLHISVLQWEKSTSSRDNLKQVKWLWMIYLIGTSEVHGLNHKRCHTSAKLKEIFGDF